MSAIITLPSALNTSKKRKGWWIELEPQWQKAFQQAFFNSPPTTELPKDEDLVQLAATPTLRLTGPTAPYPNLSFEMSNVSGIAALSNLEIVVVSFCKLTSLQEIASLSNLKSLFVNNNQITSLSGVEKLRQLKELYCQENQLSAIKEMRYMLNLETFYCNYNLISSLEGLTEKHADKLTKLFCLPNEKLPQKEIIRVERDLGIRCWKG